MIDLLGYFKSGFGLKSLLFLASFMKQPSGNISAVYKYRFGEKSSVLQNNAPRQNSRSQSQTLFQDNKAEMPEEHLDRSQSRLQSLYNCFFSFINP